VIKVPTTLILGAGSAPDNFPRGRQLCNIINNKLDPNSKTSGDNWYDLFSYIGFRNYSIIENFRAALFSSDPQSIDSFLEFYPQFLEIGKLCIALALIPQEKPDRLMVDPSINWYRYLRDCLLCKPSEFVLNRLSVVTFNYDRSLEHYLFTTISSQLGLDSKSCAELLMLTQLILLLLSLFCVKLLVWNLSTSIIRR
jgi:hypothetical protein